jgi:DHA1 family bicyclomycin/chloramphenicol resistance-like MFS transporter
MSIASSEGSDASPKVSLLLLVFIAFSGTLAMHIFVPALPGAAHDLKTDSQTIQFAITIYILGLALGQLIYGPLSDAIGRRNAILAALAIYLLGSIGSALAVSANTLIAARFVQSLGGAGGLALTRVVVSDTSKGNSATKSIAILNLILLLGPGFAPVIGAEISELVGWRMIFVALAIMAVTTIAFSLKGLPETGRPSGRLSLALAMSGFANLFRNRHFMRIATGGAFGSTACYGYFVSAPFILGSDMGLSVQAVGYCVGSTLAAAAAGTLLTRSIVGKVPDRTILLTFSGLGLITGAIFLGLAVAGMLTPVLVVGLSLLILFSAGGMGPVTVGTTLRLAGQQAGSAAGLFGCFQMLSGVICSFVAGLFTNHELGCGLVLFGAYLICFTQFARPVGPRG